MKNKIAGMVTLYNPTDQDIGNIFTYINEIDKLYIIDNTEGYDNRKRLPKNQKNVFTRSIVFVCIIACLR